jgi:type IV pilus assembly protein PilV
MKESATLSASSASRQRGVTLIEILVTMLIIAFGVLGLIGMNMRVQGAQIDAYQRAQAILLVQDMAGRIRANYTSAPSYVTTTPLGTGDGSGDTVKTDCSALTGVAQDKCDWSNELKGAGEQGAAGNVGAMIGARGCISKISSNPSVYQVQVSWQGTTELGTPSLSCGTGSYSKETLRRTIGAIVPLACLTAPATACTY